MVAKIPQGILLSVSISESTEVELDADYPQSACPTVWSMTVFPKKEMKTKPFMKNKPPKNVLR